MNVMGAFLSIAVVLFLGTLAVATLLLPFYIIAIHGQLCKIRMLLEGDGTEGDDSLRPS